MSAVPHSSKYENQTYIPANSNVPRHLLDAEQTLNANCFTIGVWGEVDEGIYLDFNHPSSGGKAALILGEGRSYVMRDAIGNRGCLYQQKHGRGFVRRAELGEMEISGGKKFPLLRKPEGDSTSSLVVVGYGLPMGVRVKDGLEPLYSGVGGTASRIAWGEDEALVEVNKSDTLLIFSTTGEVGQLHYEGLANFAFSGQKIQPLSADEALTERLKVVERMFKSAVKVDDLSRRVAAVDKWFHELASMILQTETHPDLREDITKAVGRFTKEYGGSKLNPAVRAHFDRSLRAMGDDRKRWWLSGEEPTSSMLDHLGATERKGPPKAVLARKSTRSQADQKKRNEMRGSSSGGGQKPGKQKGGKK